MKPSGRNSANTLSERNVVMLTLWRVFSAARLPYSLPIDGVRVNSCTTLDVRGAYLS
jgi:hypothetical protein